MNVFVLNTGRCGSTTFIEACRHITNYTCGHETRAGRLGAERFAYPGNHIEADNRLSWFLGRCDRAYGDRAFYVHLTRDERAVARSFARRFSGGIIRSYRRGMLMRLPRRCDPEAIAADYCETVTRNIELFLKDKTRKMGIALETAEADFPRFWRAIGAEGDLDAALAEFRVPYNASKQRLFSPRALVQRLARLVLRRGLALGLAAAGAALAEEPAPLAFSLFRAATPEQTVAAPEEEVRLQVPVANRSGETVTVPVAFTLLDFWLQPHGGTNIAMALKPGETQTVPLVFQARDTGPYKVAARYDWQGETHERDVASFAVWPRPRVRRDDTFFRDVISCWEGDARQLKQAARLGQGWVINHDMMQSTWWAHLQPTNGPFQWQKHAYQVTNAVAHGFRIVGSFHTAPRWASVDPQTAREETKGGYPLPTVPAIGPWRTYVTETVRHYKDRIRIWQVGNEPHVPLFWSGSIEQFAERCQVAAEAAHRADPGCTVLGSGLALDYAPWLERFARAGGFARFDAVSYHAYVHDGPPEELYENLEQTLANLKRLLRDHPPHRELPIWNTEGGSYSTTWLRGERPEHAMSWRAPAYALVKHYAIEQSLGVVCHFYYLQNGGNAAGLSPLDVNRAPLPLLMARLAMQAQVDGLACKGVYRGGEASGRVWAVLYESPGWWRRRTTAVCWAGEQGEVEMATDWGGRLRGATTLMGGARDARGKVRLTEEPIYLRFAADAAAVRAFFASAAVRVIRAPQPLPKPPEGDLQPVLQTGTGPFPAAVENPDGLFTVDLRPWCNMGFADEVAGDGGGGWRDEGPLNDMRCVVPGRALHYGVPFDLVDPAANGGKSLITMKGMTTPTFPGRLEIPLHDRACRSLYFLHSGYGCAGLARYEIHYADGQTTALPLDPGKNIHNWWFGYQQGEETRLVPFLSRNTVDGKPAYRYLRVWEWQNPRHGVPIRSLSIVVDKVVNGYQQLSLVALSGVRW